jgi:hypothetical protein
MSGSQDSGTVPAALGTVATAKATVPRHGRW